MLPVVVYGKDIDGATQRVVLLKQCSCILRRCFLLTKRHSTVPLSLGSTGRQ